MTGMDELWSRANTVIAGGASSNARTNFPLVALHANGAHFVDADGNKSIDYVLGMGPAILGHAPSIVTEAVIRSLSLGQCLGATHPLEIELAELITSFVPSMESLRFTLTGTEADQLALRLARAHTGRQLIVKFEGHYHGWLDNVLISLNPALDEVGPFERPRALAETEGQANSALKDVIVMPWNDLGSLTALLEAQGSEIAGVIMEPIMCNTLLITPRPGYLEGVRRLCDRFGIVLIFDEVITGFRVSIGGAQELYGIRPDLSVFAKALAGGFPLACVGGKREIMDLVTRGVFHGGTCNANLPAVAAALATLTELSRDQGAALRRAQDLGQYLMSGLRDRAFHHGIPMLAQGFGTVFTTAITAQNEFQDYRSAKRADMERYADFVKLMRSKGVRISMRGNWYVSTAHEEADVDATLAAADEAFAELGQIN